MNYDLYNINYNSIKYDYIIEMITIFVTVSNLPMSLNCVHNVCVRFILL